MTTNLVASSNQSLSPTAIASRPLVTRRYTRAFYESLAIALLFCWSPSNGLGYIAPFAVVTWYVFRARSQNALIRAIGLGGVWIVVIGLYTAFNREFVVSNAVISILTYSALAPLVIISSRVLTDGKIRSSALRLTSWMVCVQAVLGIVQAVYGFTQTGIFYGVNGDFVEGTIHPALAAELSFSNPMFAVNMTFMLLSLVPAVISQRKYRVAFILGSLALILASVLHVLYFLFGALILAIVLYFPSFLKYKAGLSIVVAGILFTVIAANIVGVQPDLAENFLRANLEGRTPRGVVTGYAFNELPNEYLFLPLVGIGPGQFSSRAGLIGSGYYFGKTGKLRTIPFMPTAMSPVFRKYIAGIWIDDTRPPGLRSSSTQPYYSWLSVYVEFGGIVTSAIVLGIAYFLLRLRRFARTSMLRIHTIALGTGVIFLFLLGMQENYWEIPQAILLGVLLLKLQYANLRAQYEQSYGSRVAT